jgi:hypothetical protein
VLQALKAAGAQVTPDQLQSAAEVFERKARALEQVLGVIDIRSVVFGIRHQSPLATGLPDAGPPAAQLYWTVTIDTIPPEIKPASYVLHYEPFEGKLTGIQGSLF